MVLPFVALTMGILVGTSALVIDVGNGRRIKEDLVTATDASALAAAYDYATENPGAACGTATSYLAQNEPTALLVGCDGFPDPISGRVAVTATVNADTFLASILGIDDIDVTTS
ncbi:MAG: hypothetical protein GY939_00965, partial [Actinomycetia bacterium]|nr:hypothetical protein [Actinomycetes bacterium]